VFIVLNCIDVCDVQEDMNTWMGKINSASGTGEASMSPVRAQTLPVHAEGSRSEEPKKRGFFTLGKKK